ncbi:unnamed protein product [Paramecium primaurelia]|uniref:Uncharacterized protein n=1 Tax=Paramecium primaurelia TaxID=5886 RepID=A0A8S1QIW1_PARPR|nr:unnamed protein product [Paramecium primaurelia]
MPNRKILQIGKMQQRLPKALFNVQRIKYQAQQKQVEGNILRICKEESNILRQVQTYQTHYNYVIFTKNDSKNDNSGFMICEKSKTSITQ